MAKNAYMIVSDLHKSYKNLRNRINYASEVDQVQMQIVGLVKEYKKRGYQVFVLLLGDVFHGSYNDVFGAVRDNNFFIMLSRVVAGIYTVIGNHELTYYSANPFYTLVSEIQSQKIHCIMNKVWAPAGVMPVIHIVDELQDGDVVFHFNHYGTAITDPKQWEAKSNSNTNTNLVHIGLFHQNLVNQEILKVMQRKLGRSVMEGTVLENAMYLLGKYRFCFFGHLHSVYGVFITNTGTKLCYLASLGRTSVLEISNNFLERNLPVVLVEEGRFLKVEDNKFHLMKREECVNEYLVCETHARYEIQKSKNKIKKYVPIEDRPQENVRASLSSNPQALQIFNDLLNNGINTIGCAVGREIENVNRLFDQVRF